MGELEKLKTEKTVRIKGTNRSLVGDLSITIYKSIDIVGRYHSGPQEANEWLFPSNFVLSSNLLADLKILKNVETSLDIWSNF